MPLYRNNSRQRKNLENIVLEPNQEKTSLIYYDIRGKGDIELLEDYPYYSPILISEKIEKNTAINIPKVDILGNFVDKFIIHMYLEKGDVEVNFNVPNNKVPLKLYEKAKWNIRCTQRLIDKIFVSGKDFVFWFIAERLL